jgi:MerR family mercuric resistance operon transcriptional regulator
VRSPHGRRARGDEACQSEDDSLGPWHCPSVCSCAAGAAPRGAARRATIVAAAAELFAGQGFGASTRDIAASLRLSQALLYRYFPSKAALVDAVLADALVDRWQPEWTDWLTDATTPAVERLTRFYRAYAGSASPLRLRLWMQANLAGMAVSRRYSFPLTERVLEPIAMTLRAEADATASCQSLRRGHDGGIDPGPWEAGMPSNSNARGELLTRGQLARLTGCNIETIRYYEQIGLLPSPRRSEGGHRLYGQDLVKRLSFVRRSRGLGFTLEEIHGLLDLVDGGRYTCAQVECLAREHVHDIQRKIADLRKLKKVLETMASQCSGESVPACPIIDALLDSRTRLPLDRSSSKGTASSHRG